MAPPSSGWFRGRKSPRRIIRPDQRLTRWQRMQEDGTAWSLVLALGFCVLATLIFILRGDLPTQRPGDWVSNNIYSRVDFTYADKDQLERARELERDNVPPIFKKFGETWDLLEERLIELPDRVAGRTLDEISPQLRSQFEIDTGAFVARLDTAALTALDQYRAESRQEGYRDAVKNYVTSLRRMVVVPGAQRNEEMKRQEDKRITTPMFVIGTMQEPMALARTFAAEGSPDLVNELRKATAANFGQELQTKIIAFTLNALKENPTHVIDPEATLAAQNDAAARIPPSRGEVAVKAGRLLVPAQRELDAKSWQLLKQENREYLATLPKATWWAAKGGTVGIVLLLTAGLGTYIYRYQPRVVRNHARGIAIGVLLLSMLLLAQLAAIGSGPLYLFGLAPSILVAMILAIAYDRRFAMGVSMVHATMVTVALGQGIGFFLVSFIGVLMCCHLMDEIRSRSKLIEIGGATALAMMAATLTIGIVLDPSVPKGYIGLHCLYAGAAGLSVGFVVLGILPFIERAFRITTGMTLLELADASHPLLRRLSVEAPGTYNHSLQVATLAEAAAEAIGANSLLCRVGAYYHDIGKINKADYFVENQVDGVNRHMNLSPSVSLLIIIGHVKDGVEMARDANLPPSIIQFIQQHHGTTLVEYFYHQARQIHDEKPADGPGVPEAQYRYPGPKPRTRETGIVMLADVAESATRALGEPNASRIESLVHELTMRRVLDGQFDECDLTMRDIQVIGKTMVKTLLSIYHGRIAYPSTTAIVKEIDKQQPGGTTKTA